MKIQGGGSGNPVDIQKVRAQKENAAELEKNSKAASSDWVDAKLSKTLASITEAIKDSGLTAAELHSNIDEERAGALLDSFERVAEGRQPRLEDDQIMAMADRVGEFMDLNPSEASSAFRQIDRNRVEDLLSS
ncbi:MAG: hypothetical protein COV44_06575 [Deltaproteobacteria bacterium CG11_big_fil_rev_8_21_14_0_20_45_16]|nr:MAG: hypothetical protein COV44_06575 [Deltaproteobacteria bacterium CG11_big_fil_rev_8_21_14_0_20_45_16]